MNVNSVIDEDFDAFRDHIATVDQKGKRIWMYPKKPSGKFYKYRTLVSYAFLILFLVTPFIKVNGEQFMLLNILERKFVILGVLFTPQDFYLFALLMVTFMVFIILFTVIYGRLFCGWVCPQTVFMEMFFRKIEYWIEGDWTQQKKLDSAPWSLRKFEKKALKHVVFFAIAFVVGNYFLAYIIGMDEVLKIIREPVSQHVGGFIAMLVFAGAFYGVFARLREQVCTTICPYGRLQGVLLVDDTTVIAYDHKRGEPRGKLKQKPVEEEGPIKIKGDCIDCKLCIAVCPTGIDIRNGTQLECVNCTACIDACDEVMDKIGKPRGLIRYDSKNGIVNGNHRWFTTRVYAYSAILLLLIVLDVFLFLSRGKVHTIILHAPGQIYREMDDKSGYTNVYTYTIINKTSATLPVQMQSATPAAQIRLVGVWPDSIPKGKRIQGTFFIDMRNQDIKGMKNPVVLEILSNGKSIDKVKTNFMGPRQ